MGGGPGVDDLVWREAVQKAGGPENPDRLWPVLASGFASLRQREAAQVPNPSACALHPHCVQAEQRSPLQRKMYPCN